MKSACNSDRHDGEDIGQDGQRLLPQGQEMIYSDPMGLYGICIGISEILDVPEPTLC